MHTGVWCENLKEDDHLKDPRVTAIIILKWVFKKWDWGAWTTCGSGQGQVVGSCEFGNEPSGSIKCGEYPD
jgi:hypothetical protein